MGIRVPALLLAVAKAVVGTMATKVPALRIATHKAEVGNA